MYNASRYRRLSSFVWTVCKGDWVPEQPPPPPLSRPLTAALGSVPLQASWVLQDPPTPLKERIKKEKLYLFVVEGPLFSCWTSLRSHHYFPVPFPWFEDCMSLSFHSSCPFCLFLTLVLSCKLAPAIWRELLSSLSTDFCSSPFFAVWEMVLVYMESDSVPIPIP